MKKLILLITMAFTLCATNKAEAMDFWAVNADSDTICYDVIYGTTNVFVTYNDYAQYTGIINIPSTVIGSYYNYSDGLFVTDTFTVTGIGGYAFYGCTGLTSVNIPNSVTTIEGNAFEDCTGLTSIHIPYSATDISRYAFDGCDNIISVSIHCPVIGDWFAEKPSLTSVTLGDSVTTIGQPTEEYWGYGAFAGCTGLTSVTIGNSVTTIEGSAFRGCTSLTSIDIPNSVTTIGEEAFRGCTSLTSIDIPNSVTTIGDGTFFGCTGLTSIDIPNSVTTIGGSAFEGCTGLTSVSIPNSVTTIEGYAFGYCSGLTSIDIPNSVTTIGGSAFTDCTGLTSVTVPNSVTTIERRAFSRCTGLTSVVLGDSLLSIQRETFYNCSALSSVTIPNSVTTIEERAFKDCTSLPSIIIPASVDSIGAEAFMSCPLLEDVVCLGEEPPVLVGADWFEGTPINRRLHVPCNSLEAYKASIWRTCFLLDNIICDNSGLEEAEGGLDSAIALFPNPASDFATISLDNLEADAEVVICDLQGRVVSRQSIAAGTQNVALDLSNLSSGTYSVTITSQNGTATRKLIKR